MSKYHGKNGKYGAPLGGNRKKIKEVNYERVEGNRIFERIFEVEGVRYVLRANNQIDCSAEQILSMVEQYKKTRWLL